MMPAMKPLLDLSRTVLWHWKTFPIILPPPITAQSDQTQGEHSILYTNWSCLAFLLYNISKSSICSGNTSMTRKKTINIRDLFIEPNFNELEAVSTDSKGAPKKLNHSQLESLRSSGEFQVDSVQFSGQKHTWRLSKILQKGSDRSKETMYKDLSHALKLLGKVLLLVLVVVVVRAR